ncbi:hypothetical protein NW752_004225 [Fusarium irregulare]|uniref:PA14 domain-containing protein n=1 Tax=Fusarium irregulare TaxID=2494466 RepID=A0A9W8U7S2_9HYPO|nr:hypothetical protein NW766_007125 [Fusarium irregulare]KAJ4021218.1 hypothetical protein NW752_004225 [Fusarium irregulare]
MQSIITFAGLAFANLAVAGPCRPIKQSTVSSDLVSTTSADVTVVTVVPVPVESTSEAETSTLAEETSTFATVVIQETSSAAIETSAETTAEADATTTAEEETDATTTAEVEAGVTTTAEADANTTTAEAEVDTTTAAGVDATTTTAEIEAGVTTTAEAEASTSSVELETSATTSYAPLPTADQSCENGGLDYAIYKHTFYNSDAPHFSSFDATFFHTAEPTYEGITERIGIQPGTDWTKPFTIYEGSPEQMWQYKAVDHRGFLFAPETGTYKVTVPNSDEITLVWFGNKAISGWTRQNADLEQDYPGGTSKSFEVDLEEGTYTPFRLLWANAQGELNFIAEVQAPGGQVIVNGDGADNAYLVRYACDGSTPEFPGY